jgi:hypothetical protein
MAKKRNNSTREDRYVQKKKTSIGHSERTKTRTPGPGGNSKHYKKKYRGQGK